jgi:hypothetical protein
LDFIHDGRRESYYYAHHISSVRSNGWGRRVFADTISSRLLVDGIICHCAGTKAKGGSRESL